MADKALIDERLKSITAAREIHENACREKRNLTDEEDANYKRYMNDYHNLDDKIKRGEDLDRINRELDEPTETEERDIKGSDREVKTRADLESEWTRSFLAGGEEAAIKFQKENRDLSKDSNILGGYWLAPETFLNRFIQAVDNAVLLRGLATKLQVGAGHAISAPSLDTDVSDASWTAEAQIATKDSTARIGKRALTPHPLSKLVQISKDLISRTGEAEKFAAARIAYKMAVTEESAFMTGTGAGQPLGLFTASDNGISTGRDVSTGNTTTTVKGDGLISAKGTLKPQYRKSAKWIMHRDVVTSISKLKDGVGGYMLLPAGLYGKNTDMILGNELIESEYAPSTMTTGLYVGMIGDYSNYWIADAGTMGMQRLVELYAASNQIGLLARRHVDGMPVLEEAFVRVTLA